MQQSTVTVNLGDEYDEQLWASLRSSLIMNGAIDISEDWGVGGSQELDVKFVKIKESIIRIESETYVGISIEGPSSIIEKIIHDMQSR